MWVTPTNHTNPDIKIFYRVSAPKLSNFLIGQKFHYFKLKLFEIDRFFQVKKSWNKDYPPGQQIYSDTATATALRKAIAAEHSILYSGRSGRDGNVEGQLDRAGPAFFDLLDHFRDTESASIATSFYSTLQVGMSYFSARNYENHHVVLEQDVYTYVLMEDSFRFSKTGAGKRIDFSSKHALHAGAAEEVVYAGEFWIEKSHGAGPVMYIDNNSGTFAPPGSDLFRMKGLMEANFPGIPVEILDYRDPRWKDLRGKKDQE